MDKNKIKDNTYIQIQSFMVKELNLKGNELLVYAIIYGFSQDGNSSFSGSLQYLQDWTNSSKQGVLNVLSSLQKKNLIEKTEIVKNNIKYCSYKVVNKVDLSTKLTGGGQQSGLGWSTKLTGGGQQSGHNNIYNNIDIEILDNTSTSKTKTLKHISTESVELAHLLLEECKKQNPHITKTEAQLTKWADEIGKLNPKYDWDTIRTVLVWCKQDSFWASNIMSGSKFKQQFEEKLYPKCFSSPQQKKLSAKNYITYTNTNEVDFSNCPF